MNVHSEGFFDLITLRLAGACTAGGERLASLTARGGHVEWICRCGFRRRVLDAGGADVSSTVLCAAQSGSATLWRLCAFAQSAVLRHWCTLSGHSPTPHRSGRTPSMHAFEAIRPGRRLTFRRGSSLMVRQVGLSHTMWSGSSIPFPLALVCRTLVPGPKNTFLTVCFRFASWTGQFIVVPRAIWIVF